MAELVVWCLVGDDGEVETGVGACVCAGEDCVDVEVVDAV